MLSPFNHYSDNEEFKSFLKKLYALLTNLLFKFNPFFNSNPIIKIYWYNSFFKLTFIVKYLHQLLIS